MRLHARLALCDSMSVHNLLQHNSELDRKASDDRIFGISSHLQDMARAACAQVPSYGPQPQRQGGNDGGLIVIR